MNSTTVEQSKRLLDLGLSPSTCDLWWDKSVLVDNGTSLLVCTVDYHQFFYRVNKDSIPSWSLEALIVLIPRTFGTLTFKVLIEKDKITFYYQDNYGEIYHSISRDSWLEVAYEFLCELLTYKVI